MKEVNERDQGIKRKRKELEKDLARRWGNVDAEIHSKYERSGKKIREEN